MKEQKERKLGATMSYFAIIASIIVQLIYTPFLIKMLGQSEYGLYSLVTSIIGYLTILDFGFGNAIIVYTSKYRSEKKYDEEKKLHGMFFAIYSIIGLIAVILGIVLYFNMNNIFENTMTAIELKKAKIMVLILTFNLFITFTSSIYPAILSAYEKFVYKNLMSLISIVIKPLIMIPLLTLGFKSITMTIIVTIVNVIVIVSNYLYCKYKLKITVKICGFDKQVFKQIFSYSFYIFLGIIVNKINWSLDNFILGAICGTKQVSIYAIAGQLNILFNNFSTAISGVLLPKLSKMVAQKSSNEEFTSEFIKVGRIQYLIIFLMTSGLVLFGKEFFILWAGKDFKLSYYVAVILIVPASITLIQNLGTSILQAKNKHKFISILNLFVAIFNVIISIPLARKYGSIGTAIGTAITLIIGNILILNIYYKKNIGLDIIKFWKAILKMTIPFIFPISLVLILKSLLTLTGYSYIIIFGSIYTICYSIISYWFVMNDYEKNIIKSVLKKLRIIK